ncbi:hypothetical protein DF182_16115 [Chitinophaga flava]|uniref:BZIP transcription factor n=2 Tax=Chitinophaga flava TaxID=2259036 RepID=A0A365Y7P7_9BACT|nr:hypothetical protein DF182_16115 [Chitinophaga flava]
MLLLLAAFTTAVQAQTTSPTRTYWTNIQIPGYTDDATGVNYLILHRSYDNVPMDGYFVMGKISAIRGHIGAWNRKWTIEVNTASAHKSDRGSLICYNEPAQLVTLRYNGVKYLAVSIQNSSTLTEFSFTGYIQYPAFEIVKESQVSEVALFRSGDPVTIAGNLVVDDNGSKIPTGDDLSMNAVIVNTSKSGAITVAAPTTQESIFAGHHMTFFSPNFQGGMGISIGQHNSGFIQAFSNTTENGSLFLNPNGGGVGIGVHDTKGYRLAVAGSMIAERVVVKNYQNWPDFVFAKNYQLPSLQEVEAYVNTHQHLPGIPSAAAVKEKGIDLEEMNSKLLQKVEELTLYLIQLDKENKELKAEVKAIRSALQK